MNKIFLGLLLLIVNVSTIAKSDFDKGMFLINKSSELTAVNQEINNLLLAAKTATNKDEQQKILCQQKVLLERKISLLNELIYSDEVKNSSSLQTTRLSLIQETHKLTTLSKSLDQLPMQKYGKTLHQMCLESSMDEFEKE